MQPTGMTNQGIGLAWAWMTLGQGAPFNAPAKDPNYTYKDAIILLSDGLNTQNRYSNSASQIDARQKILCDNAKAAGIHDLYGPCQYWQPPRPDVGGAAILRQQPRKFLSRDRGVAKCRGLQIDWSLAVEVARRAIVPMRIRTKKKPDRNGRAFCLRTQR